MVAGSGGLIGSDVSIFFARRGVRVTGIDSNQAVFFGPAGRYRPVAGAAAAEIPAYRHEAVDIRDRVLALVEEVRRGHRAHSRAALARPRGGHSVSGFRGERAENAAPAGKQRLAELEARWEYADPAYEHGMAEDSPIDRSRHSLFGASKVAADVMVQDYGRYFNMPTCCLRGPH